MDITEGKEVRKFRRDTETLKTDQMEILKLKKNISEIK